MSITLHLGRRCEDVAYDLDRPGSNVIKALCLPRLLWLASAPALSFTAMIDTIRGIGSGCIASVRRNEADGKASKLLFQSTQILSVAAFSLIKTINPRAAFENNIHKRDGSLTTHVRSWFYQKAYHYTSQDKLAVARLLHGVSLPVYAITRIADGIIGALALILALVTVGKSRMLNSVAYRGLSVPGFIMDLFSCLMKMIDPRLHAPTEYVQRHFS